MTAGYTKMFEAYLTISDYTSSLSKVKMNGKTFEKIFDVKVKKSLDLIFSTLKFSQNFVYFSSMIV